MSPFLKSQNDSNNDNNNNLIKIIIIILVSCHTRVIYNNKNYKKSNSNKVSVWICVNMPKSLLLYCKAVIPVSILCMYLGS